MLVFGNYVESQAPSLIIDWIVQGYELSLLSLSEPFEKANHKSAMENKDFVSSAVTDLVSIRCVLEVDSVPRVCSPLSVVTNRKRLMIDLRYLNGHLLKENFKCENLRLAMLMFQKGDYLFSFDLKSGYHHVDIHKSHWQYLGFAWDNEILLFQSSTFWLSHSLLRIYKVIMTNNKTLAQPRFKGNNLFG